ncbi:MAG: LysR family transcriptional regulator [Kutzneria sp.]|nr:LysR family transcriptional regulator [Kutzneria sp.]
MDGPDDALAMAIAPRLAMLCAIGAQRHVTRAAAVLGVPQPTVSRWLAELADELGAPVVCRDGRGVRLTRAGELLAEAAIRAVDVLRSGCRQALDEVHPERGRVVLGFLHLLGRTLVPGLLRGFRAAHPAVRFGLTESSRGELIAALRGGAVDLALIGPPPEGDDLRWARMDEQEVVLALPLRHRLAGRRRVRITELAEETFVGLEHGFGLRQLTDEACAAAGFVPDMAFEGQDADTVRGLVAAGLGVALVPRGEPGASPEVVEVPVSPTLHRVIALAWLAGQPLPPAVAAFRDYAVRAVGIG